MAVPLRFPHYRAFRIEADAVAIFGRHASCHVVRQPFGKLGALDVEARFGIDHGRARVEIKAADERYARFSAFINKQVYTYNARKGAKGGSEFMELGYLRPDIILKDLVKISHPDLFPDYKLYFHRRLQ